MVMRGMKVNYEKRMYITKDCKRVADEKGIPFGNIVDPLGYAVERCYSLYGFAKKHGKEEEYLRAFGQAVWADGTHGYMKNNLKKLSNPLDWSGKMLKKIWIRKTGEMKLKKIGKDFLNWENGVLQP